MSFSFIHSRDLEKKAPSELGHQSTPCENCSQGPDEGVACCSACAFVGCTHLEGGGARGSRWENFFNQEKQFVCVFKKNIKFIIFLVASPPYKWKKAKHG